MSTRARRIGGVSAQAGWAARAAATAASTSAALASSTWRATAPVAGFHTVCVRLPLPRCGAPPIQWPMSWVWVKASGAPMAGLLQGSALQSIRRRAGSRLGTPAPLLSGCQRPAAEKKSNPPLARGVAASPPERTSLGPETRAARQSPHPNANDCAIYMRYPQPQIPNRGGRAVTPLTPEPPALTDGDIARLEGLLDALPAPLQPLDVSALDGYLCGVLLQPQRVPAGRWLPRVVRHRGPRGTRRRGPDRAAGPGAAPARRARPRDRPAAVVRPLDLPARRRRRAGRLHAALGGRLRRRAGRVRRPDGASTIPRWSSRWRCCTCTSTRRTSRMPTRCRR